MMPRRSILRFALLLAACGPTVSDDDTSGAASGTSSGAATHTSGSSNGASSTGSASAASDSQSGSGSASGSSSSSSTGEACQVCFVDGPCNGSEDGCLDAQTIQRYETISCEQAIAEGIVFDCDPRCCQGASCSPSTTEPCEPETSCVETLRGPQCRPTAEICDGVELRCGEMQVCEYGPGLCPASPEVLGLCVDQPEVCPEPADDDAECGCDGMTYASACLRRAEGVALDHPGECF